MTTYLSIDVATKSLAIGLYCITDLNIDQETKSKSELDCVNDLNERIAPLILNVFDLNKSKKSKDMTIDEKACALKLVLIDFDKHLPHNFIVLIEYQMNANHMSNAIFNMIVYHYAGRAAIHTVFPSLKNSISMNNKLKLSDFLASASSNYSANKNHCKYNFLYFMFLFRHEHLIKDIKQKNIDDIADTFMQCVAFHLRN